MPTISFRLSSPTEWEVSASEAGQIAQELTLIDRDAGESLSARIRKTVAGETGTLVVDMDPPASPGDERWALMRALEHLWNLRNPWPGLDPAAEGESLGEPLNALRMALFEWLGEPGTDYAFVTWDKGPARFLSHSGPYAAGDMIVTPDRKVWRVRAAVQPEGGAPGRLECDPE